MVQILWLVRDKLLSFLREEKGQDVFEYLLIIGGVSVMVILAIATPVGDTLIDAVISGVCSAISTIDGMTGVSC
jgi:Flp pilus assembly pilin Flp